MKGIAGIVYPDVFQVNRKISPMLSCLQTSSEESYGSHVHKNIEIGSCSTPMFCNEKKDIYVALYGFLDNPDEIRDELKRRGVRFAGKTDGEVIVSAFEHWGKDFLNRIEGSFALAILDQRDDRLILARDSTGKKPLYWYQDDHRFLFSSQLKSLLITGFVPQTPDPSSIAAYFYFGYCPQDITPLKGVSKLLPGYYLELKKDKSLTIEHFWSYSSFFERRYVAAPETIVSELDTLLKRSVEKHLTPGETIGCFLSGGVGSASVAYYLQKLHNKNLVKAYSVGFQEENERDIEIASDVAEALDISQRRLLLTPKNFLNDFVRIAWELDEPLADLNTIATWNLAKLASEQTRIVYSGMGSDELFAGHNRYTISERGNSIKAHLSRLIFPFLAHWFAPVLNLMYKPAAYSLLKHARADSWHVDYMKHNALFSESMMSYAAPKLVNLFDPELFLNKFYHLSRIKTSTSAFLYFDVKTRMADLYIAQYEKLTAAFNLQWYSPFLNRKVVEFAAGLPEPEDLTEIQSGQYLKRILKNLLPDSVLERPKKSRPQFLQSWLHKSELPQLFQQLEHGLLVEEGYISREWVRQHTSGLKEMSHSFRQLWALLTLEVWFRIFINNPISEIPPEMSINELLSND